MSSDDFAPKTPRRRMAAFVGAVGVIAWAGLNGLSTFDGPVSGFERIAEFTTEHGSIPQINELPADIWPPKDDKPDAQA